MSALAPLLDLATSRGLAIDDYWGRSSVSIANDPDLGEVAHFNGLDGYIVVAYFGSARRPLRLGATEPTQLEIQDLEPLCSNERLRAELVAATSANDVAQLLSGELNEIEIRYESEGWVRTSDALVAAVEHRWTDVADSMPMDVLTIGDVAVPLTLTTPIRHGKAMRVVRPRADAPDQTYNVVWSTLAALADAAAWTNLAVDVVRDDGEVRIALHNDQDAVVPVSPRTGGGGAELLCWLAASADGNREEALRFVFRFVSAASPTTLPDAITVERLAERQRIALSRDQAAEVQRAIAQGHTDTVDALRRSASELASQTSEMTSSTNATVVAALGVIALVARGSNTLPSWLVGFAALAIVGGMVLMIRSRYKLIGDQQRLVCGLVRRLNRDPLLPADDLAEAQRIVTEFNIDERVTTARRSMISLGLVACSVAVAAAVWVIWIYTPSATATPVGTTTTTSATITTPATTTTSAAPTTSPTTTTSPITGP